MNKPVYIAAYHQSEFGKLMALTVPDIIRKAVAGVCATASTGRWWRRSGAAAS
jgi:hypothetical protein